MRSSTILARLRSERPWGYFLVILIPVLTFLPLASSLGFYDDDWFAIWGGFFHGPGMIAEMHLIDRPFAGLVYGFHYSLLGNTPLAWQVYVGALRIIAAVAMYLSLRKIWPENKLEVLTCTLIAAVFPGFSMHPNAHTFSNHFFGYMAAIVSIAFTVHALFEKNRFFKTLFIILAIVLELVNLLMLEYMIGIEILRYILIGVVISRGDGAAWRIKIRGFLRAIAVYLLPLIIFLSWRLFFFEAGRRSQDVGQIFSGYLRSPFRSLIEKVSTFTLDFFETVFASWFVHGYSWLGFAELRDLFIAFVFTALGLTSFWLYWFFFHRGKHQDEGEDRNLGARGFLGWFSWSLGTLAPVVLADRQVILRHSFSRYSIQTAFGVGLFIMGGVYYATRPPWRLGIFSFLLGLAMMSHYQNAVSFQADWEHQKDLWWQMSWRAPELKPDTVLVIMPREVTSFTEGYEIWGPANLVYSSTGELRVTGQVLNKEVLTRIQRQTTDRQVVRNVVPINRDYDDMLLAAYSNQFSCLHVVDSQQIELGPSTPSILFLAALESNINQIIPGGQEHPPPADIFGPEPEHTWCYYYQKINLARQQADWELAADFADEALARDFKPLERIEWMSVFEAYSNTGQEDQARAIAKILRDDKGVRHLLCIQLDEPPAKDGYRYQFIQETLCGK